MRASRCKYPRSIAIKTPTLRFSGCLLIHTGAVSKGVGIATNTAFLSLVSKLNFKRYSLRSSINLFSGRCAIHIPVIKDKVISKLYGFHLTKILVSVKHKTYTFIYECLSV